MRMSQEEKVRSHARIVDSASRIVRTQGIERPSVADFMSAAGMTQGGFYRHFETRDDLILAAFEAAGRQRQAEVAKLTQAYGPAIAAAIFKADYLSEGHVAHPELGCPLAAVAGDVARAPDALKAVFGAGLGKTVDVLAAGMTGGAEARHEQALREFAMMVGAVILARAADSEFSRTLLAACRTDAPKGRRGGGRGPRSGTKDKKDAAGAAHRAPGSPPAG